MIRLAALLIVGSSFRIVKEVLADWEYKDNAPLTWAQSYPACAGKQQSPIDIVRTTTRATTPGFLKLWTPIALSSDLRLYNNGHFLVVDMSARGVQLTGSGFWDNMVLESVHFHAPAEHLLDGLRYPLESHYVFTPQDASERNIAGHTYRTVVMALLHSRSLTIPSSDVLSAVAESASTVITSGSSRMLSFIPKFNFPDKFYVYKGSVSKPPCTETVDWYVGTAPIPAQSSDIDAIDTAMKAITGSQTGNARPVQPVGDRVVRVRTFSSQQ
eukprot:PhM_4_TR18512/c0_g1_i1/m.5547/K01674/cah; carbonic anhydrase